MRNPLLSALLVLTTTHALFAAGDEARIRPAFAPPSAVTASAQPAATAAPAPASPAAWEVLPSAHAYDPSLGTDGASGPPAWACRPPSRFWLRAEYLLWWIKESQYPPLVTTAPAGASVLPGVLGQPGTTVLFGGGGIDNRARSGGRFGGGFWLDDCGTIGLEASYFFLGSPAARYDAASSGRLGSSVIARPFFDVTSGTQNAQLVAFPALANGANILIATGTGLASGEIHVSEYSRLQGAELNLLCIPYRPVCCDPCGDPSGGVRARNAACRGGNYWVSLLAGFRYLQLDEGLSVDESSRINPALPTGAPLFGGSTIAVSDRFDTRNYFYGPQIGGQAEFCRGRFFANLRGKVALGVTHQVVDIHGSTVITAPDGTSVVAPAGFLATASNSGHFTRDRFGVVPEAGANVGYQVTPNFRAFVGYTFLYWSSVVRPGDQIDLGLSGTQIPTDSRYNPQAGSARPAVQFRETDFWAQGVNFGLEYRY